MSSPSTEILEQPVYTESEFALIDLKHFPKHVALVMDGNRRWAEAQGLPPEMGHWQGAEKLDRIVRAAAELGVKTLTVYAFSTENWNRPQPEVDMLMQLLEAYLRNKRESLVREGVRLKAIGDIEGLPGPVKKALFESMQATKHENQIDLVLALNYGGRDDIRRAVIKMFQAEKGGSLNWNQITEETISSFLDTASLSDPDLLIRPSGEHRISNFLVWQIAYTEIYVTDVLWPDFSPRHLLEAVIDYQKRHRRYGG